MDPVAYLNPDDWATLKTRNPDWNEVNFTNTIHLNELKKTM